MVATAVSTTSAHRTLNVRGAFVLNMLRADSFIRRRRLVLQRARRATSNNGLRRRRGYDITTRAAHVQYRVLAVRYGANC